ncbi:hypothetical protein ES711_11005 [Gelidibacter salicanalis]|uniref:Uncharacterized protein n=1 Tax=Gelidibacter salicanalis TaxID=291193 RepID=A0A5C7AIX0_9FLAO|nr:hypothetical protein [Gelidibacter salicanalis]TXE07944.1 hypothetical protein ES711_11005 [Gelidibacter salicanalis]
MNSKKIITYGIGLLILEITFLGLWTYQMEPDPSVSLGIIIIVPFLFVLNIIIGILFYIFKSKLSSLFFINSIVCPLLFFGIWNLWYMNYQDRISERFEFVIGEKNYEVSLSKKSEYFSISDMTNQQNGTTTGLYFGKYEKKADSIKLTDGETKMYIVKKKLIGFPEKPNEIKLTESE